MGAAGCASAGPPWVYTAAQLCLWFAVAQVLRWARRKGRQGCYKASRAALPIPRAEGSTATDAAFVPNANHPAGACGGCWWAQPVLEERGRIRPWLGEGIPQRWTLQGGRVHARVLYRSIPPRTRVASERSALPTGQMGGTPLGHGVSRCPEQHAPSSRIPRLGCWAVGGKEGDRQREGAAANACYAMLDCSRGGSGANCGASSGARLPRAMPWNLERVVDPLAASLRI